MYRSERRFGLVADRMTLLGQADQRTALNGARNFSSQSIRLAPFQRGSVLPSCLAEGNRIEGPFVVIISNNLN